jgi:hypothetical protein
MQRLSMELGGRLSNPDFLARIGQLLSNSRASTELGPLEHELWQRETLVGDVSGD